VGFGVGVGADPARPEVVQLVEAGIIPFGGVVLEHMARPSPAILHSPSVADVQIGRLERVPSHVEALSSEPDSVMSMVRQNSTPASQVVAEPYDSGVQSTPVQDHVVQAIPPPPLPYPPVEPASGVEAGVAAVVGVPVGGGVGSRQIIHPGDVPLVTLPCFPLSVSHVSIIPALTDTSTGPVVPS